MSLNKNHILFIIRISIGLLSAFLIYFIIVKYYDVKLEVRTNTNQLQVGKTIELHYYLKNDSFQSYAFFWDGIIRLDSDWFFHNNGRHTGINAHVESDKAFLLKPGEEKVLFTERWNLSENSRFGGYYLQDIDEPGFRYIPIKDKKGIEFYAKYKVYPGLIALGESFFGIKNVYKKPVDSNRVWVNFNMNR